MKPPEQRLWEAYQALEKENNHLLAQLDCSLCNSGHQTLPLRLWDCPECTRLKHEAEITALKQRFLLILEFVQDRTEDTIGYYRREFDGSLKTECEKKESNNAGTPA
jgi:hypothetical protein